MLPHWEVLAIGGLMLFILLLMIITISLARHVSRLKHRLRRSAEVLVPGNANVHHGTIINGYATTTRANNGVCLT